MDVFEVEVGDSVYWAGPVGSAGDFPWRDGVPRRVTEVQARAFRLEGVPHLLSRAFPHWRRVEPLGAVVEAHQVWLEAEKRAERVVAEAKAEADRAWRAYRDALDRYSGLR